ncbi:MAG: hypothetical protein R6X33_14685 [Candidatus Brocadiia bacterium]
MSWLDLKSAQQRERQVAKGWGCLLWPVVLVGGIIGANLWGWFFLPGVIVAFVIAGTIYGRRAQRRVARLKQASVPPEGHELEEALGEAARIEPQDLSKYLAEKSDPGLLEGADRIHELIEVCLRNPATATVAAEFGAGTEEARDLYNQLIENGAGQWRGGRYVPVATLLDPVALRYALDCYYEESCKGRAYQELAFNLLMYFEGSFGRIMAERTNCEILLGGTGG